MSCYWLESMAAGLLLLSVCAACAAPLLWLWDAAGQPRAGLSLVNGEPGLGLWDAAGRIQWQAP